MMQTSISRLASFLLVAALAATSMGGCRDEGISSSAVQAHGTIGPAGGTVDVTNPNSPLYGAKVTIPPGAVSTTVTITISTSSTQLEAPSGALLVDLGPNGLTFDVPIMVTLPYSDDLASAFNLQETALKPYFYNGSQGRWEALAKLSQDTASNLLVAETTHFTHFSVLTPDSWAPITTTNAPTGRSNHTAVWTGTKMIVWGGTDGSGFPNAGGRYDTTTDSWNPTSTVGAPGGRTRHTATWTGTYMAVYGGWAGIPLADHATYDEALDSWSGVATWFPNGLYEHSAVWMATSSPEPLVMIFGGTSGGSGYLNDIILWQPPSAGALLESPPPPLPRGKHSAVVTGTEAIIWGGTDGFTMLNDGYRWSYVGGLSWVGSLSSVGAPSARKGHTAIWTGTEMIVWGGDGGTTYLNTGARYDPNTDSWTPMTASNAPSARSGHVAVWTGTKMIVWGGYTGPVSTTNTGGVYDPATDAWTVMTTTGAPSARNGHTAVWTGTEMLIWGGDDGTHTNTGAAYKP